jgi:hypothetical protein
LENLVDLFERINQSSIDEDVKSFLKSSIEVVAAGKPQSQIEDLVDDIVGLDKE